MSSEEAALEPSEPKRIDVSNRHEWLHLLADGARRARANAYAPYSSFAVGAALLAQDGRIFLGVNVENAAFPTCLCAEVNALGSAVSAGARRFVAIAVCAEAGPSGRAVMPCGNCRQALSEFGTHLEVVAVPPGVSASSSRSGRLSKEDALSEGDVPPTRAVLPKWDLLSAEAVLEQGALPVAEVPTSKDVMAWSEPPLVTVLLRDLLPKAFSGDDL